MEQNCKLIINIDGLLFEGNLKDVNLVKQEPFSGESDKRYLRHHRTELQNRERSGIL